VPVDLVRVLLIAWSPHYNFAPVIRRIFVRSLKALVSFQTSPVVCCLASLLLLGAPIALVAPARASESNNTLPAEEETKSGSPTEAKHNQTRHRLRPLSAKPLPVSSDISITTSSRAPLSAPNGLSEHAHREGLGTPLRC
jgi:hypothetical protein